MADESERVSNANLQKQLINLIGKVDLMSSGIQDIKQMFKTIEERVRRLEASEAGTRPLFESKIDAAWRKLDEHEGKIQILEKGILSLQQSNKILSWVGGILGGAVILWIITQLLTLIGK